MTKVQREEKDKADRAKRDEARRKLDLDMMLTPDNWPNWPLLPLVHRETLRSSSRGRGVGCGIWAESGGKLVFFRNLYLMHWGKHEYMPEPETITAEQLIADGWSVD